MQRRDLAPLRVARFCPEADCIPVEEQVLLFDAARSEIARSQ